ncbi:transcription factor bHLH57-like [Carex rostrata]
MERLLQGAINEAFLFEEDMSSSTTCHGDLIPGYNPEMPFLKLLQSALQEVTPSTCASPIQHDLDFQNYHSNSDVIPKIEQMDSCITHEAPAVLPQLAICSTSGGTVAIPRSRRRKRPRSSPSKKPEEAECQRRTHITVERNRRRLMNGHFATLKSLIPSYLVQRGDQASIVGGAINFVKDLEQQLLSLQAEKQSRTTAVSAATLEGFFISPQYTGYSRCSGEGGVDVEATVVQGHVNLKVAGRREVRQLLRLIASLQQLKMSVLHLMVTTMDTRLVLYCFNLKMEEGCRLGSADEIAAAVHHIFSYYSDC